MRQRLQLPISSYKHRSTPASPADIENCHIEALPPDAKTPFVLMRSAGIRPHATPGTGSNRGYHTFDGDPFVVVGTSLYRVAIDGTETLIGTIPGSGSVSMDHNPDYLVIVAEPNAYYTDGTTVTQITDADFVARGAKYVAFCDNFMVFTEPGTGRFFWADVGSVTDFDSLNFVTAEGDPDATVGIVSDHLQIIPLGQKSMEIFDSGADGFERTINGYVSLGCLNGDTVAKRDNTINWAASDFTIRKISGATPIRISTHPVEQFMSTVDVSTLSAYAYDQDGHFFYLLNCSSGCFTHDVTTDQWHKRKTYPYDYFRWQYQCFAHGRHYVGDFYSNEMGYFDPTWYKDGDGIQRMSWTYQPVYADNRLAIHHSIEIVMEVGVGLTTGQGSDPEIMLSYSDDGGVTWTNLPNRKIGKMGEYKTRVRWNSLGSSNQRVYRAAVSDPVRIAITDTIIEVTGGRL